MSEEDQIEVESGDTKVTISEFKGVITFSVAQGNFSTSFTPRRRTLGAMKRAIELWTKNEHARSLNRRAVLEKEGNDK